MSSTYLTSTDITMIYRLLAEANLEQEVPAAVEAIRARKLVAAFQRGVDTEVELRGLLSDFVHGTTAVAAKVQEADRRAALEGWDNEGGAKDRSCLAPS